MQIWINRGRRSNKGSGGRTVKLAMHGSSVFEQWMVNNNSDLDHWGLNDWNRCWWMVVEEVPAKVVTRGSNWEENREWETVQRVVERRKYYRAFKGFEIDHLQQFFFLYIFILLKLKKNQSSKQIFNELELNQKSWGVVSNFLLIKKKLLKIKKEPKIKNSQRSWYNRLPKN